MATSGSANDTSFNEDEVLPPDWLNTPYFTKVLSEYEKSREIVVRNVKITPGTVKGDHYASVMFRAVIEYTHKNVAKSISLIVKTMPEIQGHKRDLLKDSFLFKTEIAMYAKILPKVHELLRSIGDNEPLSPPCVYASLEPRETIIFEDMLPHGYCVVRGRALSLADVQAAYVKLAKLHAISYKLLKEQPELLQEFRYGLTSMPGILEDPFIKGGIDLFIELLYSVPEFKQYTPYFEGIRGSSIARLQELIEEYNVKRLPDACYVLCHGDFHGRNMMFKYDADGSKLDNCVLLDFQISNVGPIVHDIIYSTYMLMTPELRDKHKDELIFFYFSNFIEILKQLKFTGPLPKLIDFHAQRERCRDFEIFLLHTFLPLAFGFFNGEFEPSELLQSVEQRRQLYKSPVYITELRRLLPMYLRLGYFENIC